MLSESLQILPAERKNTTDSSRHQFCRKLILAVWERNPGGIQHFAGIIVNDLDDIGIQPLFLVGDMNRQHRTRNGWLANQGQDDRVDHVRLKHRLVALNAYDDITVIYTFTQTIDRFGNPVQRPSMMRSRHNDRE